MPLEGFVPSTRELWILGPRGARCRAGKGIQGDRNAGKRANGGGRGFWWKRGSGSLIEDFLAEILASLF